MGFLIFKLFLSCVFALIRTGFPEPTVRADCRLLRSFLFARLISLVAEVSPFLCPFFSGLVPSSRKLTTIQGLTWLLVIILAFPLSFVHCFVQPNSSAEPPSWCFEREFLSCSLGCWCFRSCFLDFPSTPFILFSLAFSLVLCCHLFKYRMFIGCRGEFGCSMLKKRARGPILFADLYAT